jgi:hypothetical protein
VYGSNPIFTTFSTTNASGQAEKSVTMPIPFETLIPYGIIIAVSSAELPLRAGSGR